MAGTGKYGFDNPLKDELLGWVLNPIKPDNQQNWAQWSAVHDLSPATVQRWRNEPRFRKHWERGLAKMNVDPERTQKVVDGLQKAAADGNVQAAKLWMDYVTQWEAKEEQTEVSSLSDTELDELILELAHVELAGRQELSA